MSASGPSVVVVDPGGARRAPIAIGSGGITIGREAGNTLVLDDGLVSRRHARIEWDGQRVVVTDLGSSNGTRLGDQQLRPHETREWRPGEWLGVGGWFLQLVVPGMSQPSAPIAQAGQAQRHDLPTNPVVPAQPAGGAPLTFGPPTPAGSTPAVGQPTFLPGVGLDPAVYGTPPVASGAVPAPSTGRIRVVIEENTLTITPGQPSVVRVTLANTGATVDHLRITVEGVPADWVRIPDTEVQLVPGGQAAVAITVNVARTAQNRAGHYEVTIRASSRENPGESGATYAMWNVLPFTVSGLTITPARAIGRTSAQYELTLQNESNTPATFELSGVDDEQALRFRFASPTVTLDPAGSAKVPLTVVSPRRLVGGQHVRRFTVRAVNVAGGVPPQTATGELVHKALAPTWVAPVAAVAVLALGVLAWRAIAQEPELRAPSIEPSNPVSGEPVTIRWDAPGADTVSISPLPNAKNLDADLGQFVVANGFSGITQLTVEACNRFGCTEQPLTINPVARATEEVAAVRPTIVVFEVAPREVEPGGTVTVRWEVRDATRVAIEPFGTMDAPQGEQQFELQQSGTITIVAENGAEKVERGVQVRVGEPLGAVATVPPQATVPPPATQPPQGTAPPGQTTTTTGGAEMTATAMATMATTDPTATTPQMTGGAPLQIEGQTGQQIVMGAPDGTTLYAVAAGTLYRTEDGGATWTEVGEAPQGRIMAAWNNPALLYAGDEGECPNGDNGASLQLSTDGGATWEDLFMNARPLWAADGPQDQDPVTISNCNPVYSPNRMFEFNTLDVHDGTTTVAAAGPPDGSNAQMAVTTLDQSGSCSMHVFDVTNPWLPGTLGLAIDSVGACQVAWGGAGIVLATDEGIYLAPDGNGFAEGPIREGLEGVTIDPVAFRLDGRTGFTAIVIDPGDPNRLWLGSHDGVFISEDGGFSWELVVADVDVEEMAVAPMFDRLYVTTGGTVRVYTLDGR